MKTVLITGGATGLGKELAKFYAKDYNVILAGRNQYKLKEAQHELGDNVYTMSVDITKYEEVGKSVEKTADAAFSRYPYQQCRHWTFWSFDRLYKTSHR